MTGARVYYRLGRYAEAVDTLQRSLSESGGENAAFDLLLLALCHARRGDGVMARDCYERGIRWLAEHQGELQPGGKADLDALRAEAALIRPQTKP